MTAINLSHYLYPRVSPKKEYAGIAVVVLLFLCFPAIIKITDPVAAPLDAGALSLVVLAISSVLIFKTVTGWLIRIIWPAFAKYSENHFEENFNSLSPLQKVCIYLGFYLAILLLFVLALAALG